MSVQIHADLMIQQQSNTTSNSCVTVQTLADGTLLISSVGDRPAVSIRQMLRCFKASQHLVRLTGQRVVVSYKTHSILVVNRLPDGRSKMKFRWWSLVRGLLLRNL